MLNKNYGQGHMLFSLGFMVMWMLSQQSYAANMVDKIRMLTEIYTDKCFYHPDYAYCAENTDPLIVANFGGKSRYIDKLESLKDSNSTIEFIYTIVDKPAPATQIGSLSVAIVPIQNVVLSNKRLLHVDAYLMALSADKGASWKFADFNNKVLANIHPELIGKISQNMLAGHQHSGNEHAIHRVGLDNYAERLAGPQPRKGKIKNRRYIAEDGAFSIMLPYRFGWYRTVVTSEKKDSKGYDVIFESPDTTLKSYNLSVKKLETGEGASRSPDMIEDAFSRYKSTLKRELNADITIVRSHALEESSGLGKYWKLAVISKNISDKLIFLFDVTIAKNGNHIITVSSAYNLQTADSSRPPTIEQTLKAEQSDEDGFLSTNALSNSILFN